tara:strand:- start:5497 stop:6222 length:726 start_codon:yes stop_codon:yes gene_type:complete
MKIALCLHGLFNSMQDTSSKGIDGYNHIKKHILDKGDVDVFIHSWELNKKEEINFLYEPKHFKYEQQKDFSFLVKNRNLNSLKNPPRSPESVLSHLYSVTESIKLAFETNIKYDIVIKARFDLGRINRNTSGPGRGNPYPVQCINFQKNIKEDKIYMANWNHFHMGPADMWFYGSSTVMSNFTDLYNSLEKEMNINSNFHLFAKQIENNEGDLSNAIAFYKWWMINNNMWENRINLETTWE